jgi:hypothetical protein
MATPGMGDPASVRTVPSIHVEGAGSEQPQLSVGRQASVIAHAAAPKAILLVLRVIPPPRLVVPTPLPQAPLFP